MAKIFIILILGLVCSSQAVLVSTQLVNSNQINPNGMTVLGAVNTIFSGQPTGGSVNGVLFEDAIWGNSKTLSTGALFYGDVSGDVRTAYTSSTISGTDAAALRRIADGINFYNLDAKACLTFSNLPANIAVQVQLITSDAAANIGNWSGIFSINTINSVNSAVTNMGSFQAGTEPNFYDAQLATFDALTDANGYLIVQIHQITSQHAGVAGIAVYAQVPELSSMVFLSLFIGFLLLRGRNIIY